MGWFNHQLDHVVSPILQLQNTSDVIWDEKSSFLDMMKYTEVASLEESCHYAGSFFHNIYIYIYVYNIYIYIYFVCIYI